MADEQYKISLGVDIDTSDIKTQINGAKLDPIKVNIDFDYFEKQINKMKTQIKSLGEIKVSLGAGAGGGSSSGSSVSSSAVKELNKEMAKFVGLQGKISKMKFSIDKLTVAGGKSNQIAELNRQLSELEDTYGRLMHKFMKKLTINADVVSMEDVARFDDEIVAAITNAENKFREFEAKFADTRAALAKEIKIKLASGEFSAQISKIESDSKKFSHTSKDVQEGIRTVNQALNDMAVAVHTDNIEDLISANQRYERALKSVQNQLKQNNIKTRDIYGLESLQQQKQALSLDMGNWLKENSAAAKQFGERILELQRRIVSCDATDLKNLRAEFQNITREAKAAGVNTKTFGDSLKEQWNKYKSYLSVASLTMYASQALRDMFEQVKLIDSAMTELKKVTNETDATYNNFLDNAAERAREIGTTIDGLVSSTADFARLGYGFEDAQGLAEVANIYAVVGDEIEGVEGATESLISTMSAFKNEMNGMSNTDFAMSIVDKFNEVSNNFAISSGGIGEAMERSASSLMAANNTIDESIALITAANTVVQDPDQVGRLMPTLKVAISVKLLRRTRPRKDFVL